MVRCYFLLVTEVDKITRMPIYYHFNFRLKLLKTAISEHFYAELLIQKLSTDGKIGVVQLDANRIPIA